MSPYSWQLFTSEWRKTWKLETAHLFHQSRETKFKYKPKSVTKTKTASPPYLFFIVLIISPLNSSIGFSNTRQFSIFRPFPLRHFTRTVSRVHKKNKIKSKRKALNDVVYLYSLDCLLSDISRCRRTSPTWKFPKIRLFQSFNKKISHLKTSTNPKDSQRIKETIFPNP